MTRGQSRMIRRAVPALRRRSYRRSPVRYRRRSKSKTIPILPMIGLAPSVFPVVQMVTESRYQDALNVGIGNFTGYSVWDKKMHFDWLINTYTPVVAGWVGHIIANKLGINRSMKKLPLVGKYLSL